MATLPSDPQALPDSLPAFAVPMVDIAPYVSGGEDAARSRVAVEMDAACREVGFVQVRGHGVPEAPDALLVNLGDLTARWTHERWRSTLHRVQPPVIDGRIGRRRSAAYFHDGNFDALIEIIASCRGADGSDYPPIRVADHLAAKLAGSRAGMPNTAAGREVERLKAAWDGA